MARGFLFKFEFRFKSGFKSSIDVNALEEIKYEDRTKLNIARTNSSKGRDEIEEQDIIR